MRLCPQFARYFPFFAKQFLMLMESLARYLIKQLLAGIVIASLLLPALSMRILLSNPDLIGDTRRLPRRHLATPSDRIIICRDVLMLIF